MSYLTLIGYNYGSFGNVWVMEYYEAQYTYYFYPNCYIIAFDVCYRTAEYSYISKGSYTLPYAYAGSC